MNKNITLVGVYMIKNIVNGRVYVGSTTNIKVRIASHKYLLKKGIHESKMLQNDYNSFGINSFVFDTLEVVANNESLLNREQFYIDALRAYSEGYNACPFAGKGNKGRVFGKETVRKHKEKWERLKGQNYDTSAMGNRSKKTKDTIAKLSGEKNGRSKLRNEDVLKIKELLALKEHTQKEIARMFGIDSTVICRINTNKYWRASYL